MKTISVGVLDADYESFRQASTAQGRPIAQLIREAMSLYRREHIERRTPLRDVPTLAGHRLVADLPARDELYDEIFPPASKP
jgi:hypothetical protein